MSDKENDKMIYAIAISAAVAGGIMDYQNQTKAPEPPPKVETVKQAEQPKPTVNESTPKSELAK